MDPTRKRNPKSTTHLTTNTTKPHHHQYQDHHHSHPQPDPTITPPSSIQSISHQFSKLYANHKKLTSLKKSSGHSKSDPHPKSSGHSKSDPHPKSSGHSKSDPHPQPDTNFQIKPVAMSSVLDISFATLTKSNSQQQRNNVGARTKVKTYQIKKPSSKKSYEEYDVKKAANLMSKSAESDQIKKLQQGCDITSSINGGRRRSFCTSEAELADFFTCSGVKVVSVDMPPFMQIHAVDCARKTRDSLEKFTSKTLALTLKREFDGVYGPAWHCIVGTSFGSFVTHSVGGFMYFSMDSKLHVLLFKTTVHKAH